MRREQILQGLIARHVAGSRAYGTNGPNSDMDFRGVFIAPKEQVITPFFGNHKTYEDPTEEDTVYYELRHFMDLASKMNPNVIETLWVRDEDVIDSTLEYGQLRRHRAAFMSRRIADTTVGFAHSELAKFKKKLEAGTAKWKHAMHVVRLMRMGVEALRTGELVVYRPDASELLEVKEGKWSIETLKEYAADMTADIDRLRRSSPLPEKPDTHILADLMIELYESHWETTGHWEFGGRP
jgi:predicted nucleotidyltransferase